MSYLDIPCARLHYEVDGDGPPVLLVHAGVAHLRMWDEQVSGVAGPFQDHPLRPARLRQDDIARTGLTPTVTTSVGYSITWT